MQDCVANIRQYHCVAATGRTRRESPMQAIVPAADSIPTTQKCVSSPSADLPIMTLATNEANFR